MQNNLQQLSKHIQTFIYKITDPYKVFLKIERVLQFLIVNGRVFHRIAAAFVKHL